MYYPGRAAPFQSGSKHCQFDTRKPEIIPRKSLMFSNPELNCCIQTKALIDILMPLLVLNSNTAAGVGGIGSGGSSGSGGGINGNPGTPAGTYTISMTVTSCNITATAGAVTLNTVQ